MFSFKSLNLFAVPVFKSLSTNPIILSLLGLFLFSFWWVHVFLLILVSSILLFWKGSGSVKSLAFCPLGVIYLILAGFAWSLVRWSGEPQEIEGPCSWGWGFLGCHQVPASDSAQPLHVRPQGPQGRTAHGRLPGPIQPCPRPAALRSVPQGLRVLLCMAPALVLRAALPLEQPVLSEPCFALLCSPLRSSLLSCSASLSCSAGLSQPWLPSAWRPGIELSAWGCQGFSGPWYREGRGCSPTVPALATPTLLSCCRCWWWWVLVWCLYLFSGFSLPLESSVLHVGTFFSHPYVYCPLELLRDDAGPHGLMFCFFILTSWFFFPAFGEHFTTSFSALWEVSLSPSCLISLSFETSLVFLTLLQWSEIPAGSLEPRWWEAGRAGFAPFIPMCFLSLALL